MNKTLLKVSAQFHRDTRKLQVIMGSLLGIAVEAYVSSGTTRPIFKLDLVCTYFKLGGDLNTMTYNDDDVDV